MNLRAHQLSAKMIDFTHDTLPEVNKWRPILKTYDKIPPQPVLEDKTLLREWEQEQHAEYFSYVYNRLYIDQEAYKKLQQ